MRHVGLLLVAVPLLVAACASLIGLSDVPDVQDSGASDDGGSGAGSSSGPNGGGGNGSGSGSSSGSGASSGSGSSSGSGASSGSGGSLGSSGWDANAAEVGVTDSSSSASSSSGGIGIDGAMMPLQSEASSPTPEAGVVSYTVPIPGPDGGSLLGSDGGVILGELIDDLDSENPQGWILSRNGREGTWFTYDDGTQGGIFPAPNSLPATIVGAIPGPDGQAGNLAAHATGNGAAAYAGLAFNLAGVVAPTAYDATAYRGFTFWGRIGGDSGSVSLKFAVPDRNTLAGGGVCPADAGTGCGDYFAKSVTFTPSWTQFVIYYSQLGQTGWGLPKGLTGLDAAHVYSCQFQPAPGAPFDVWIDDIYFIDK